MDKRTKNRVGLGTFPFAGVFSKISRDHAKKIISFFLDSGGYYIDTAPLYGFGEVETLLGEVIRKYPRNTFYIVTKCGYVEVEGKTFQTVKKSGKYNDVIRECEISLKRLNIDYIDLYLMHSPDPNTSFKETMEALNELQRRKKVLHIGVSNVNLEELKEFKKYGKVEFIQNRFSLINRSIDDSFQNYLLKNKIGLIPYQVIDRGQITGKALKNISNLRQGDLRAGKSDWELDKVNTISKWVRAELLPIARRLHITIGQLSIAWALHKEYIPFVIVGLTNKEFIPINLKASEVKLTPKVLKQIDPAYEKLEAFIREKYGKTIREFRGLNEKFY